MYVYFFGLDIFSPKYCELNGIVFSFLLFFSLCFLCHVFKKYLYRLGNSFDVGCTLFLFLHLSLQLHAPQYVYGYIFHDVK